MLLSQLSEGLIASMPRDNFVGALGKRGFQVTNSSFHEDLVRVLGPLTPEQAQLLSQMCNIAGWYAATFYTPKVHGKGDRWKVPDIFTDDEFVIDLEPKYDAPHIDLPPYLYHASPRSVREKILERGLSTRSGSKRAYHPERVYMALSEDDVMAIVGYFSQDAKIAAFRASEEGRIDPAAAYRKGGYDIWVLPREYAQKYEWFKDPNFQDSGVYTTTSINPYYLRLYREIPPK